MNRVLRSIGITGGIGTGKSTVLDLLRRNGWAVLDADSLAHEAIRRGRPAYTAIVRKFGPAILTPAQDIDRSALAQRVFARPADLKALNAIVHPPVIRAIKRFLSDCRKAKGSGCAVSVPLLYEAGIETLFDCVAVVKAPSQSVRTRLGKSRGMTARQIAARAGAQMPLAEKCRRADFVLDNSGGKKKLEKQVQEMLRRLTVVS